MTISEEQQVYLVGYLADNPKFDAPYGVLDGFNTIRKVPTISFGIAGCLDAMILILSPNKFLVKATGPLARKINGKEYDNIEALKRDLLDL